MQLVILIVGLSFKMLQIGLVFKADINSEVNVLQCISRVITLFIAQ